MRLLSLSLLCLALAGCAGSPLNPPRNQPAVAEPMQRAPRADTPQTAVALSFSGGGLRAAAFSYGVLEGLREQPSAGSRHLL